MLFRIQEQQVCHFIFKKLLSEDNTFVSKKIIVSETSFYFQQFIIRK